MRCAGALRDATAGAEDSGHPESSPLSKADPSRPAGTASAHAGRGSAHLVSNGGVSLLEQEAAECRWPLDGSEQRFCGLPAQARSYCAQNAQRAVSDLEKLDP